MFKVEAVVNGDQLETLLLAAKAANVQLSLGVVQEPSPPRSRKQRRKGRSTKGKKRKYHSANMQVKVGPEPEGPPAIVRLHRKLKDTYGDSTVRKGQLSSEMSKRFKGFSAGYLTKMIEGGSLLPA